MGTQTYARTRHQTKKSTSERIGIGAHANACAPRARKQTNTQQTHPKHKPTPHKNTNKHVQADTRTLARWHAQRLLEMCLLCVHACVPTYRHVPSIHRGTHGVLKRCASGIHRVIGGVLTGYSEGTHRVVYGVLTGYSGSSPEEYATRNAAFAVAGIRRSAARVLAGYSTGYSTGYSSTGTHGVL